MTAPCRVVVSLARGPLRFGIIPGAALSINSRAGSHLIPCLQSNRVFSASERF